MTVVPVHLPEGVLCEVFFTHPEAVRDIQVESIRKALEIRPDVECI